MIFRKRGKLTNADVFVYNGIQLDIVSDFNYLAVVFHFNGLSELNQQTLAGKGLKAMGVLIQNIKKYDFHRKLCASSSTRLCHRR